MDIYRAAKWEGNYSLRAICSLWLLEGEWYLILTSETFDHAFFMYLRLLMVG